MTKPQDEKMHSPELIPSHVSDDWLTLDMRKDADVCAIVVFPSFGRVHYAGMDCWCHPESEPHIITHNVFH